MCIARPHSFFLNLLDFFVFFGPTNLRTSTNTWKAFINSESWYLQPSWLSTNLNVYSHSFEIFVKSSVSFLSPIFPLRHWWTLTIEKVNRIRRPWDYNQFLPTSVLPATIFTIQKKIWETSITKEDRSYQVKEICQENKTVQNICIALFEQGK